MKGVQSIPLSLFKVFPFASCGKGDQFEQCPTSLDGRKVLRKVLKDGENCPRTSSCNSADPSCKGSPDDFAQPGYFASNLVSEVRYPAEDYSDPRLVYRGSR